MTPEDRQDLGPSSRARSYVSPSEPRNPSEQASASPSHLSAHYPPQTTPCLTFLRAGQWEGMSLQASDYSKAFRSQKVPFVLSCPQLFSKELPLSLE